MDELLDYQKRLRVFYEWVPIPAIVYFRTEELERWLREAETGHDSDGKELNHCIDTAIYRTVLNDPRTFIEPTGDEKIEFDAWVSRKRF